ncbi:MAG: HAD family hydrolase [Candidatus Levyibacteriota bacterium]
METLKGTEVISLEGIQAVIFDMDGVMIDNMGYHDQAWEAFLKRYGKPMSYEERLRRITSRRNHEILGDLFGEDTSDKRRAELSTEKEAIYRELYEGKVVEVPGLTEAIKELRRRGLKLGIATTALRSNRDFALQELGMTNTFDVIVGNEDVTRGKPDPQIFTLTAERLEAQSAHCLVFEDSPLGIQAAKAAGMRAVGLVTTHQRSELKAAEAAVKDFTKIQFV